MRLLLVEDDEVMAQAVKNVLQQHYAVDIASDGQIGWAAITTIRYDLVVLDVMLPKMDGISLCGQIRQAGYQMPILLLTAKDAATDKAIGLDAGADDYVIKPFDFQELTARLRALLRRGSTTPPVLEWSNLRLDPSTADVTYADQTLHLTSTEYKVLELFLRNSNRVFSRSAIVDHLWNAEDPPEEATVKSYIKTLRQKLKTAGAAPDFIETLYSRGYRLKPLSEPQHHQTMPPTEVDLVEQKTIVAVAQAREQFSIKLSDRFHVLKQAVDAIKTGTLSNDLQHQAEQEAHKLAGTLGTFGLETGSRLAAAIEDLLQLTPMLSPQAQHLQRLVKELYRELKQQFPNQPELDDERPLLLIINHDQQDVAPLIREAATQGMRVEITPAPTDESSLIDCIVDAITTNNPNWVLLNLDRTPKAQYSLTLLSELSARSPSVPILISPYH